MNTTTNSPDHYAELIARQVDQYKETVIMHDLPPIYDYWASKHISHKSENITGHTDIIAFYSDYFQRSLRDSPSNFIISVGSGDCSIEIAIVKRMLADKAPPFFFICLELSPILIKNARERIDSEKLGDVITVAEVDINKWRPKFPFAGVMAHHALHHFLELEVLFDLIKNNLAPNGRFLTCDMIGRNGHMRWPEALKLTRAIWERLPRRYKFNNQFHKFDDYFENWDCSTEGFEGIRAQDILPLLVKNFSFEVFYCYGNLIDPFVDRGFGGNYDPNNPTDRDFIDFVQETNEQLISEGILKPTSMVAVMKNEKVSNPVYYKQWNPEFAVRNPDKTAPEFDIETLVQKIPYKLTEAENPLIAKKVKIYTPGEDINFKENNTSAGVSDGSNYLKFGWSAPDNGMVWSNAEEAALLIPVDEKITTDLAIAIELVPYQSPLFPFNTITIMVNGNEVKKLSYDNKTSGGMASVSLTVPKKYVEGKKLIEIVFQLPNRRQPQYEPGNDLRALGIGLLNVRINNA